MKEHDLQVAKRARQEAVQYVTKMQRDAMDEKYAEHMKQFEKESEEFWGNLAKEFKSGTEEESFMAWCRHMWGIPIEVLVEEFRWKPITEDCCCDNRQNLVKFCNKCAERAEKISRDQMADIRTYCKDVAEKYGAGFVLEG